MNKQCNNCCSTSKFAEKLETNEPTWLAKEMIMTFYAQKRFTVGEEETETIYLIIYSSSS